MGPTITPLERGCPDLDSYEEDERFLRSAGNFIKDIRTPTWIIEGADGNSAHVAWIDENRGEAPITTLIVSDTDHFNVLLPSSELVALQILEEPSLEPEFNIAGAQILDRLLLERVVVECADRSSDNGDCQSIRVSTIPCASCSAELHTTIHFDSPGVPSDFDSISLQNLLADMAGLDVDVVMDDDLFRQLDNLVSRMPLRDPPLCVGRSC